MAKSLEEAQKELDDEFEQHRKRLRKVREKLEEVERAGPMDDLEQALEELEDEVKDARTGGLIGGGAKGHTKARKELEDIQKG